MKKLILALSIVLLMPLLAFAQDFDKNAINLIGNNSALTQPTIFQLKIRPFGGVYSIIDRANITLGAHDKTLDYFVVAPPKSDVAIFANSTAATSIASGSFQLQLKQ